MNLIGKILVGVIFVMSIVFMSFAIVAFSTQRDWKNKFDDVSKAKQQLEFQNSKLQQETTQLKDERDRLVAGLQADVAKLEVKNEELAKDNATLAADIAGYRDESNNATALATQTQKNMTALRDELLEKREKITGLELEKYEMLESLVKANDTARGLSLELATLKSQYEELTKNLSESRYLLTQLGYGDLSPEVYTSFVAEIPPRVEGTITDMRPNGTVVINIGRDDGLLEGHKLHVYRDNNGMQSYLGRIEITNVKPSEAAGRIMPEYREGTIMVKDSVTAYLSQVTASM